jgi:hypothetical protein
MYRGLVGLGKFLAALSASAAFLLLAAPRAGAADASTFIGRLSAGQGNIKFQDLRVHVGVAVEEQYNDNIYNASEDEEEDFISTVTPGLLLSLGDRYKLEAGYAADFVSYSDNNDENFVGQAAKATATLKFPSGFDLSFKNGYVKTEDPRSEARQVRASHWTDDVSGAVVYTFPGQKFSVGAEYLMNYLKYDQDENEELNKRKDTGVFTLSYRFLPKTTAFGEYRYRTTDYYDSADGDTDASYATYAGFVGLKWDATARMSGTVKTGFRQINYDNEFDAAGNDYADKDLWAMSGQLSYKVSKTANINIMLNRSLDDTSYTGNAVEEVSSSAFFINTGGSIGLTAKVTGKLTFEASGGYQRHEYEAIDEDLDGREDDVVDAGAGLTYAFTNWFSGSVKYAYNEYESSDDARDETHNKAFVSLAAIF